MAIKVWTGTASSAWNTAGNWTGGVPVANDDVVIGGSSDRAIDAYDASGVAINSFVVEPGYSQTIGTATAALQISVTGSSPTHIEFHGTGFAYVDLSGTVGTPLLTVYDTAAASVGGYGLQLAGTSMGTVSVLKGDVGIGVDRSDITTEFTILSVGYVGSKSTDSTVTIGRSVTDTSGGNINEIRSLGGTIVNLSTAGLALLNVLDTDYWHYGASGTVVAANLMGASNAYVYGTATWTTTTLYGTSSYYHRDNYARTHTNVTMHSGTSWYDPQFKITYSNAISVPGGAPSVTTDFGPARNILPS